jgi:hypothetical protein
MNAVFTNTKTDQSMVYIPGPCVELTFGESKTWSGIALVDIDGNYRIKEMIDAGEITVSLVQESSDDAVFAQNGDMGLADRSSLTRYTVATLPATGTYEGKLAFATNGRKVGEGPGAGTGVVVYYSSAAWRVFATDAAVAA